MRIAIAIIMVVLLAGCRTADIYEMDGMDIMGGIETVMTRGDYTFVSVEKVGNEKYIIRAR